MKIVQFEKGYIELHDEYYVILQLNEGVHFCKECNDALNQMSDAHFGKETPFSLIILRDQYFSIDPFVFGKQLVNKNLCAISVVERLPIEVESESIFNQFFESGKTKSVKTLEQAIEWCDTQLMNYLWSKNDIVRLL